VNPGGPEEMSAGPGGDEPSTRRHPAATYDPANPADLVVVVAAGCRSSQQSLRELEVIAAMRPDARLAVLDVAGPHPLPASLIGTPTWVWQGRARWWGTPDVAEVVAALDAATADGAVTADGADPRSRRGGPSWEETG
jgi:hypothetical protein